MKNCMEALALCLKKLAAQIEKIPVSALDRLARGDFEIEIVFSEKESMEKGVQARKPLEGSELLEIESSLRKMKTREDANSFLREKGLKKDALILLAKHLDLPVQKRDSIKKISEKIIETTIGYRLRSRAIQGSAEKNADVKTDNTT